MNDSVNYDRTRGVKMSELHKQDENVAKKSNYYFINPNETFEPLQPSLNDDVIRMYGIQDLAQLLARNNPDGSKGVKLRKSYKSHIADLPGKHQIPPVSEDKSFAFVSLMPENPDFTKPTIEPFDMEYLDRVLKFEKTGPNGIPGFDSSKLALADLDAKEKKRKYTGSTSPEGDNKRKHI